MSTETPAASGADIDAVRQALDMRYPRAVYCDFGDSPELCARLLGLIASGTKTATCGALRDYPAVPVAGEVMIAQHHDGRPALVYELTAVVVQPFRDVPEDFALAEGEGDHAKWRADHIAFFARNGGFDPDMPLVCERFRLIEVLP